MKTFSAKLREKFVGILVVNAIIEGLKKEEPKYVEWFGKDGMKYLKQASTLVMKAFREGLHPNLDQAEVDKIHNISATYKFALIRDSAPIPKEFVGVEEEHLFTLAQFAIDKQCKGCTIKAYKQCQLYNCLKSVNIPVADKTKGNCPYQQ